MSEDTAWAVVANANPIVPVARARLEEDVPLDVAKLIYAMREQTLDSVWADAFFLPIAAELGLMTSVFGAKLQGIIHGSFLARAGARASAGR